MQDRNILLNPLYHFRVITMTFTRVDGKHSCSDTSHKHPHHMLHNHTCKHESNCWQKCHQNLAHIIRRSWYAFITCLVNNSKYSFFDICVGGFP